VNILQRSFEACGDGSAGFVGDEGDVLAGLDSEAGFDCVLRAGEQIQTVELQSPCLILIQASTFMKLFHCEARILQNSEKQTFGQILAAVQPE